MNTILHDPTRGWLLLTEKWPGEKPDSSPVIMVVAPHFRNNMDGVNAAIDKIYNQAVAHCLSTAIEIAKEDWDVILDTDQFYDQVEVNEGKYQYSKIQDHHPYTVEAEFEVVTQWKTYTMWSYKEHKGCLTRKIARLVKAKEQSEQEKLADIPWKPQPTESQDELWDDALKAFADDHIEAKKRFVISRKAPDQF